MPDALPEILIERAPWRLRCVVEADRERLRAWRNQAHIRQVSLNPDRISAKEHNAWFSRVLSRDDGVWTVFEHGGQPLGHCNAIARPSGDWEWSFYIGQTDAPPGSGTRMMALLAEHLFHATDAPHVDGLVLRDNPRSHALHRRLGGEASDVSHELTRYRLTRSTWLALSPTLAQTLFSSTP